MEAEIPMTTLSLHYLSIGEEITMSFWSDGKRICATDLPGVTQ